MRNNKRFYLLLISIVAIVSIGLFGCTSQHNQNKTKNPKTSSKYENIAIKTNIVTKGKEITATLTNTSNKVLYLSNGKITFNTKLPINYKKIITSSQLTMKVSNLNSNETSHVININTNKQIVKWNPNQKIIINLYGTKTSNVNNMKFYVEKLIQPNLIVTINGLAASNINTAWVNITNLNTKTPSALAKTPTSTSLQSIRSYKLAAGKYNITVTNTNSVVNTGYTVQEEMLNGTKYSTYSGTITITNTGLVNLEWNYTAKHITPVTQQLTLSSTPTETTIPLIWNKISGATYYVLTSSNPKLNKTLTTNSYLISNLKEITAYTFALVAYNNENKIIGKTTQTFYTIGPTIEINVSNLTISSFTLKWKPIDIGTPAYYEVTIGGNNALKVTSDFYNVTGLTQGQYKFTVAAYNSLNTLLATKTGSQTVGSGSGHGQNNYYFDSVHVTLIDSTTGTLHWTSTDLNTSLTTESVTSETSNATISNVNDVTKDHHSTGTATLTNLLPSHEYTVNLTGYYISQKTIVGGISVNYTYSFYTLGNPAIMDLTNVNAGKTSLSIAWTPINLNGKLPITILLNGTQYKTSSTIYASENGYTLTGLKANTLYKVQLQYTPKGKQQVTTKSVQMATAMTPLKPLPKITFTNSSSTANSIILKWNSFDGATYYVVTDSTIHTIQKTKNLNITLLYLGSGINYKITVSAYNASGILATGSVTKATMSNVKYKFGMTYTGYSIVINDIGGISGKPNNMTLTSNRGYKQHFWSPTKGAYSVIGLPADAEYTATASGWVTTPGSAIASNLDLTTSYSFWVGGYAPSISEFGLDTVTNNSIGIIWKAASITNNAQSTINIKTSNGQLVDTVQVRTNLDGIIITKNIKPGTIYDIQMITVINGTPIITKQISVMTSGGTWIPILSNTLGINYQLGLGQFSSNLTDGGGTFNVMAKLSTVPGGVTRVKDLALSLAQATTTFNYYTGLASNLIKNGATPSQAKQIIESLGVNEYVATVTQEYSLSFDRGNPYEATTMPDQFASGFASGTNYATNSLSFLQNASTKGFYTTTTLKDAIRDTLYKTYYDYIDYLKWTNSAPKKTTSPNVNLLKWAVNYANNPANNITLRLKGTGNGGKYVGMTTYNAKAINGFMRIMTFFYNAGPNLQSKPAQRYNHALVNLFTYSNANPPQAISEKIPYLSTGNTYHNKYPYQLPVIYQKLQNFYKSGSYYNPMITKQNLITYFNLENNFYPSLAIKVAINTINGIFKNPKL